MVIPEPDNKGGPLPDHVRKGRVFSSPLMAAGVLSIGDWVRDDLPDLLWPALVLSEHGNSSARRFVHWQKAVQQDLKKSAKLTFLADCLDGRLSNLERLSARVPLARKVVRERALEHGLLTAPVSDALSSYFYRPAEWLVDSEPTPPRQQDIDVLARALIGILKDSHRESLVKCMFIWSAVNARTFRTSDETIKLLAPYPGDDETRSAADTTIRAMWGAHRALLLTEEPERFQRAIEWARVFWGSNSMTSRCVRKRDGDTNEHEAELMQQSPSESPTPSPLPDEGAHLRQLALDLLASYAQALETAPARLHEPEQQEVNAGLVFRAGRDVAAALGAPDLWSSEHGSHITRMLAETRITLEWMARQDSSIYRRYQEFGWGKAKLYARIMDEIPESARTPDFDSSVDLLKRLSHNDNVLDLRVVDTRDSFSGKSLRQMAEEADLLDFYRQIYYMASGVTHSEWWSIETHAMERCLNVLHRAHLIPSLSLSSGGNVAIANAWLQQLNTLIRISLQILRTDADAVREAFDWIDREDPEQTTSRDNS